MSAASEMARAVEIIGDVAQIARERDSARAERDTLRTEVTHLRAQNNRLIELLGKAWDVEYDG